MNTKGGIHKFKNMYTYLRENNGVKELKEIRIFSIIWYHFSP